jgi:hypothetical protein
LWAAQLAGTYLRLAQFQGANLRHAQLQGAVLSEAQLQGADLRNSQLDLTMLQDPGLGVLDMDSYRKIEAQIEQVVTDDGLANTILMLIMARVGLSDGIQKARGHNVLADKSLKERRDLWTPCTALKPMQSTVGYSVALVGFLTKLACQDRWTASGIIQTRGGFFFINWKRFGTTMLEQRGDAKKCPGLAALDDETIQTLKRAASR